MKSNLRFLNIARIFHSYLFTWNYTSYFLMLNEEYWFQFLYFNLHYLIRSKWKSLKKFEETLTFQLCECLLEQPTMNWEALSFSWKILIEIDPNQNQFKRWTKPLSLLIIFVYYFTLKLDIWYTSIKFWWMICVIV